MNSPAGFPVECPGCGRSYAVPESLTGAEVTCGHCQADFRIPDSAVLPEALFPSPVTPPVAGKAKPGLQRPTAPVSPTGRSIQKSSASARPGSPAVERFPPGEFSATQPVKPLQPILPGIPPPTEIISLPTPVPARQAVVDTPLRHETAALPRPGPVSPERRIFSKGSISIILLLTGAAAVFAAYQWQLRPGAVGKTPSSFTPLTTAPAASSPLNPPPPREPVSTEIAGTGISGNNAAIAPPSQPDAAISMVTPGGSESPLSPASPSPEKIDTVPAQAMAEPGQILPSPRGSKAIQSPDEARKEPQSALETFLLAPSLEIRLAVSQNPATARSAMEAYYRERPVGPFPLDGLHLLTGGTVTGTKRKFRLFNVSLAGQEAAIPVAVEQTPDGYRVDWQAFIESYDHHLIQFFEKPAKASGIFRVVLRKAHYFGPPVPGAGSQRICYSVEPPARNQSFYVWADKSSAVYRRNLSVGELAGWETESYLRVELIWKQAAGGTSWVSLERIAGDSWRSD